MSWSCNPMSWPILRNMSRVVTLSYKSHHRGRKPVWVCGRRFLIEVEWIIDVYPKRWITTLLATPTLESYSTRRRWNRPTITLFRYLSPDHVNNAILIYHNSGLLSYHQAAVINFAAFHMAWQSYLIKYKCQQKSGQLPITVQNMITSSSSH